MYANAQGPDLPATPFLMIDSGPAVWVLDVSPATPPAPVHALPGNTAPGASPGTSAPGATHGGSDPASSTNASDGAAAMGGAGGCSVRRSSPVPSSSWAFAFGLPLLAVARLRARRQVY